MYRARAAGGGVALADGGTMPARRNTMPDRKNPAGGPNAARVKNLPPARTTQIDIAGDLKAALGESDTDSELRFEFEPIVRIPEVAVTGVAATVSWRHPGHGLLPHRELYSIAQASGLGTPLATHLINQAASDAVEWHAAGTPLVVSLPLPSGCLSDPWFVPAIQAALERVHLDPHLLLLEFAESGVLAEPELTTPALVAIRRLGVGIAIADFGVASVSLAQLGRVPADEFKIDCQLLAGDGGSDGDLIREAVGTAHSLGVAAVGYGVSTTAALTRAEDAGFDRLHGPRFGEPATRDGVLLACERAFDRASYGRVTGPRHGRPARNDPP